MISKLILGTAQFGLHYGINNTSGKPSSSQVASILDLAMEQNISMLDTAGAYGDAVEQIGLYHSNSPHRFKVLSKFKGVSETGLYKQVRTSLDLLDIPCFETYSYHSFQDYLTLPFLMDELNTLKEQQLIKKIGISVYTNDELKKVISDEFIDVIQLPFNLLDNRNIRGAYMKEAKQSKKEIHVRSVFLQGLFFMPEAAFPEKLSRIKPYILHIRQYCNENSISMEALAISYASYNSCIDGVLIGIDNKAQLLENISSIRFLPDAFDFINNNIFVDETSLLNPVNWQ